jgi:hypothetical protein
MPTPRDRRLLGHHRHSDIAVTLDIYSHVTPMMGRDAAKRLNDLFAEGEESVGPSAGQPGA